jgi:Pyruvate phosphate dikinase, AMP/ATP-binding domain
VFHPALVLRAAGDRSELVMPGLPLEAPNILAIYLQIAQYPILARQIRRRMRDELYRRGVITTSRLEQEAKEKALLSQRREGLTNPLEEEDERQWEQRLSQVRDYLTDFYFAYNLPLDLFERIIGELLAQQSPHAGDVVLTFNPELAPLDLLLKQAAQYETLPDEQRAKVGHHLEEVIVVLTKTMISDHLPFVRVAKEWFTTTDFNFIRARRIGSGKIGGKAAGMLLAWKILQKAAPHIAERVTLPRSYFVGADVFYDFLALNGLEYLNQKYKPVEQIRAEYPQVEQAYVGGHFPDSVAARLRDILHEVGHTPLIVRSSSLLEDNFGASFAGKYASYFCPNQGTPRENLRALTLAIRRVYASVYSPDALLYRRRMGLLDYDERMAVLLQEVQGQTYRRYFFPTLAGVAFSRSPLVWSPRLRREEGFVRMVLGLGTRAVERVGDDYARLVTLSHPALRPEVTPADIRRYSQRSVDVIDLKANVFTTVPLNQLIDLDYAPLRWVASVDRGDTLMPLFALGPEVSAERLVLTFDNLLQRTDAVRLLKDVLSTLAQHYGVPVEIEFAIAVNANASPPGLTLQLLQCRPQSNLHAEAVRPIPADIPASDRLFQTTRMVPQGEVNQVEYIVYVDPTAYSRMADPVRRVEVARIVGRLNKALEGHNSILIGPGRWGSANLNLGVPVTYADIYNVGALVELAVEQQGIRPEPSYGTHFFQDLVEARIYPLAVYPDEPGEFLNRAFLRDAGNYLAGILPADASYGECVKVIHAPAERDGRRIEIVMDGERALAYFEQVAARTGGK